MANRRSKSMLFITLLELNLLTLLVKGNESWTVYSFSDKGFKIGRRNLAKSYIGMPIANKIGRKDGQVSFVGLWTSACLKKMPGCDPEGQIFKYSVLVKQPFS